jgi:hypothetical protein
MIQCTANVRFQGLGGIKAAAVAIKISFFTDRAVRRVCANFAGV